jgi:hypothetical protein
MTKLTDVRVHVVRSATIPTGRYKSTRVEFGLAGMLSGVVSDTQVRLAYKRLKRLVEDELVREKRRLQEE